MSFDVVIRSGLGAHEARDRGPTNDASVEASREAQARRAMIAKVNPINTHQRGHP